MEIAEYHAIVDDAVATLPDDVREAMKDVIIVVDDTPPPQRRGFLLGLYEGVPVTAWGRDSMNAKPPDKISLFRQSIEMVARTPEEIPHIVRETLWHEIAHFLGFDHDRIHVMEERWRQKRRT